VGGRLPQELKLGPNMDEKWILKQAFPDTLPKSVLEKPKQPIALRTERVPGLARRRLHRDALLRARARQDAVPERHLLPAVPEEGAERPPGGVSQRENQAFILLLSTALLYATSSRAIPRHEVRLNLVRTIDGRARP